MSRSSSLACAAILLVAACGGGGPAAKAKAPKQPDVDEATAAEDGKSLVQEVYETFEHGSSDSLFTLLADPLYVFGPRMPDAYATRSDVITALATIVDAKAKQHVKLDSKKLAITVSPGGRSAWVTDLVQANGDDLSLTVVLTNADDLWLVEAVSIAATPTETQLAAALGSHSIVPPGGSGTALGGADTKAIVTQWQAGLLDQQQWGDQLGAHPESIVLGPTTGALVKGKKLKKAWKARMEAKTREAVSGAITAAVTGDGALAWISAPVTRVMEGSDPLPLRQFAIYQKTDDGWTLMALQESVAIGEAGAGVPFEKIVPPPLEEPKPVEDAAPPAVDDPPVKHHKRPKKKPKKKPRKHVEQEDE